MEEVQERLKKVRQYVRETAVDCGRSPDDVQIMAVTKTFSAEVVQDAVRAGHTLFGENRVQEAVAKIPRVQGNTLRWHLIGHLQSNKVRPALQTFQVIETVDSQKLARRIDRVAEDLGLTASILIQVNIGGEEQKDGISPEELGPLVDLACELENLELRGLMAIPPFQEDSEASRPYFRRMRKLFERHRQGRERKFTVLSMGMSADFRVAIQEGSTLVRMGTAIFGPR